MKKLFLIAACSAATLNASWAAAPFGQMMPMHYRPDDNRTIVAPKTGIIPADTTRPSHQDGTALIPTKRSGIGVLMPTKPTRIAVLMPTKPSLAVLMPVKPRGIAVLMPTKPGVAVLMPTKPSRIAVLISANPGDA
jgi:hypothetical protein